MPEPKSIALNIVKTETNPRWAKARFEAQYIMRPGAHFTMPLDPATGLRKPLVPARYETREDIQTNKPVPPFLVTYEDGSTEERF